MRYPELQQPHHKLEANNMKTHANMLRIEEQEDKKTWNFDRFGGQLNQCQWLPYYGNERKMKLPICFLYVGQAFCYCELMAFVTEVLGLLAPLSSFHYMIVLSRPETQGKSLVFALEG